jgi:xanthine dehydrogenase YagS FAD-binding subunit
LQVSEKGDFDWALVSCAAAGRKTGDQWTDVAVFLGAVAPIPYPVKISGLQNGELSKETIDSIAGSVAYKATPLAYNGYKVPIAQALIRRTLSKITS